MGVKVKLIGESKTYEVFTDKNGVYEAYGLPAGKYVIEPEIPLNLKLSFTGISYGDGRGRLRVELKDKDVTRSRTDAEGRFKLTAATNRFH